MRLGLLKISFLYKIIEIVFSLCNAQEKYHMKVSLENPISVKIHFSIFVDHILYGPTELAHYSYTYRLDSCQQAFNERAKTLHNSTTQDSDSYCLYFYTILPQS